MKVSLEWLREFVAFTEPADRVAHRLTMLGLEVEGIEHIGDDAVFEINVTPNRPDCLSIIGIARELAAAYEKPLGFPEHEVKAKVGELAFNVDIINPALCRRYAGRIIKGLRPGPSPEWLTARLEKCGIRPVNNIVDITNYVLLELGHPLHAFDLGTIKGRRVQIGTSADVKGAAQKVRFRALDGNEYELPEDALMIWDAERPIAIAGIMGGLETGVTDSTSDIFIESAWFDPVSVRKTSRATGLKTEASFRFERGTDIKMLKKALDRACFLMGEIALGTVSGKIDLYPGTCLPVKIKVSYEKINRVLGLGLSEAAITGILERLGFTVEKEYGFHEITSPAYRMDIGRDADLMEEIARVYGYENIQPSLPTAVAGIVKRDSVQKVLLREMKESFLKSGFTEVINYSFMGEQDLERLGIDGCDERWSMVKIKNPLRSEEAYMRTTLVPALIGNILYNVSHDNRVFRLFETARVFFRDDGSGLADERNHFAAALYKEKTPSLYRDDVHDFYIVKGIIEALFENAGISGYSFSRSQEAFLHPGQSADIRIGDATVGFIGALSPVIAGRLDIKAQGYSIIIAEFDMDRIARHCRQGITYQALPKYPCSERDTAIIVDDAIESSAITSTLKSYRSDLIEKVELFDVYKGKNIPEGKKSIAFSVRYRASDRTLKDEEIDALHSKLVEFIVEKTGGQVRS